MCSNKDTGGLSIFEEVMTKDSMDLTTLAPDNVTIINEDYIDWTHLVPDRANLTAEARDQYSPQSTKYSPP